MSEVDFPYDEWVSDALLGVLRRTLSKFSEEDTLGHHHLYINFKTAGTNVRIPDFLKTQYPDEITIVLQHQFKDLNLDENGFEVTLSFDGQNQNLYIPFDTVTSFADPSVNFGIQIKAEQSEDMDAEKFPAFDVEKKFNEYKKKENTSRSHTNSITSSKRSEDANNHNPEKKMENETDGAEVINLETFRKR